MKLNRGLTFLVASGALLVGYCRAGDSLPSQGYPASRYETLWTKSPFAVATPDATDQPSDFSLVGIANLDGVDYVSLVNKQTNERYFLASNKPQNGLSLVSITHGQSSDKTMAVIQNHGQTLTLKLADSTASAAGPGTPPQTPNGIMPGQVMNQPMGSYPGMVPQTSGAFPSTMAPQVPPGWSPRQGQPPMPMIRHPFIHVPVPPPQ